MGLVEELEELALATRLRRLADRLQDDVSQVYKEHAVAVRARWFPLMTALQREAPRSIADLSRDLGLTHTAVIQIAAAMTRAGLVASATDRTDRRRRLLRLTPAGERAAARLEPLWEEIRGATAEVVAESGHDLLGAVAALESRLDGRSMVERLRERLPGGEAEIIEFESEHAKSFRRLNQAWLEELFSVEPEDRAILDDPQGRIVGRGGVILLALFAGEIVGTVALERHGPDVVELAKMTVAARYRGRGIGRRLAQAALVRAHLMGAATVILFTSSRLAPAIELYRSLGFTDMKRSPAGVKRYQRCTVAMQLDLQRSPRRRRRS